MGKMMPGRIRQEGIDLYDAGTLQLQKVTESGLSLRVVEEACHYGVEEESVSCTCSFFTQKGYCKHIAAVEYFLKNAPAGKEAWQSLLEQTSSPVQEEKRYAVGRLFLDQVLSNSEVTEVLYQLSIEGQLVLFDNNIDWTLKITRLPDQRSYIIRDIGLFLKAVKEEKYYQIGKHYYEVVSFGRFDEASQSVLLFLEKLSRDGQETDRKSLFHLGRHLRLPATLFEEGIEVLQTLEGFEVQDGSRIYSELMMGDLEASSALYRFNVQVETEAIILTIEEKSKRFLLQGQYCLVANHLYRLDSYQERLIHQIASLKEDENGKKVVYFDVQDKERLALSLLEFQLIGEVVAPKSFTVKRCFPTFSLSKSDTGEIIANLSLDFDGYEVSRQEELEQLPFTPHYQQLEQIFSLLQRNGFQGRFQSKRDSLQGEEGYTFFTQTLPQLKQIGRVLLSEALENAFVQEKPHILIERQGSLLDITFDFEGITEKDLHQAMDSLWRGQAYFTSSSGRVFVFDEEVRRISHTLAHLRAQYGGKNHFQLSTFSAGQLESVLLDYRDVSFSKDFQTLVQDLTHPEQTPMPMIEVTAVLRDYQEMGVKWLSVLDQYGFGGILADDMGLGKTLQTLAFLSSRLTKESKVLILAPASLIYNWQEECQRFTPSLDIAVIYGNKSEREELIASNHQVSVTSYASFRQDVFLYQKQKYDYLILDEAQVMKNSHTKIARQLREFEVGNCFALSGTPIENHLGEIWSLFQIVLPGLFPSKTEFSKLTADQVSRIIRPFVLRRKKEDVLTELPDLIEINLVNELNDEQKKIYLAQLQQMQREIAQASDNELQRKKIELLSGITRLRQICDTPALFLEDYKGDSGKLESLRELLLQLKEGQHRVLIFSQFKQMLSRIEKEVTKLGLTSYLLTGSTPAQSRQEMTRAFNEGSRDVFLISLKAGGVGLNLTGADTVILVDLWWNPAAENQAISRTHRMGQTQTVEFYRLITRGTIEEKIQELQESKRQLVNTVLDGNEQRASLTVEDIKEILGIS